MASSAYKGYQGYWSCKLATHGPAKGVGESGSQRTACSRATRKRSTRIPSCRCRQVTALRTRPRLRRCTLKLSCARLKLSCARLKLSCARLKLSCARLKLSCARLKLAQKLCTATLYFQFRFHLIVGCTSIDQTVCLSPVPKVCCVSIFACLMCQESGNTSILSD